MDCCEPAGRRRALAGKAPPRPGAWVPPAGPFSLKAAQKAGQLQPLALRAKGNWLGVRFPADRMSDFLEGEGKAAGTNAPPVMGGARAGEAVRYECHRAGVPKRAAKAPVAGAASAPAVPGAKRRRGGALAHGDDWEHLKIGCPWRFNVAQYEDGTAEVRIREEVFAAGHSHDTDTVARFYPQWINDYIAAEYHKNSKISIDTLLDDLNSVGEDTVARAEGYTTFIEYLTALEKGAAKADKTAFVLRKHVTSVIDQLRKNEAVLRNNEPAAVQVWVREHLGDVFLYQAGEIVPPGGTEDVRAQGRGARRWAGAARRVTRSVASSATLVLPA